MGQTEPDSLTALAEAPPLERCTDTITFPPGGSSDAVASGGAAPDSFPAPEYLTERGRDLRIDFLRGYFVIAMIVDHVRGPSPLYLLTGGNRFYTSAAEGFILASGFVSGLVYGRLMDRDASDSVLMKVLNRTAQLFLVTVGLTLLLLPVSEILGLPWVRGIDLSDPLALVISILTLHRTYYLVDVMLLYTALFAVAPLALVLLARGKTHVVLGGSLLLWGVYQFYPEYVSLPWPIAGNYLFNFSAWQVLFFGGVVLGYHHERIPILDCRATRIAFVVTGLATLALIASYFVIDTPTDAMPGMLALGSPVVHDIRFWLQEFVFAKVDLRVGRVLASALVFSFLFLAATVFWRPLKRWLGWLFLPLGQHALYGYTAHVVIAALVAILLQPLNLDSPGPQALNGAIQVASVLIIWLLVRSQFIAPRPATMRRWYAAPAVLALATVLGLVAFPPQAHVGEPVAAVEATQDRTPRRFGTPIAKGSTSVSATAAGLAAPTPAPTPLARIVNTGDFAERTKDLVGPIKGTLEEHQFYSPELDRDMPYIIYLPPDYSTANRRYPVLYMLHGRSGQRDEWLAYGLIDVADAEIDNGGIQPMIIVLPQGDTGYWADHVDDGERWSQYLVRDVVRHIDSTYRTLRMNDARAIGGLSMGGWGALHNGFLHPRVFSVIGAHSPSLRPDDGTLAFLGSGEDFLRQDPIALAHTLPGLGSQHIWIDIGVEDEWLSQTSRLHDVLETRGIDHWWQPYPGEHGYDYWHEHAIDYIRFYGHALERR